MRLLLAILLNAGLLVVLVPWLRRQWHWAGTGWWRTVLVVGLGLRVLVGVARNWTPKLDAEFMSGISQQVTAQLWASPSTAVQTLTKAITIMHIDTPGGGYDAVYQNTSNTWFLIKLLALLNLGSLGAGWLNGLYLSVFAFVGCWKLVRALADVLPRTPAAAGVVGFLLWPSVWFWATGISKEAVLLGSGAWLTARVLKWLYSQKLEWRASAQQQILWWLGTTLLALLHFQMRYFFALPLLGVMGGVALGHWLQRFGFARYRWAQVAVLAAVLGAGVWLAPQFSIAFSINKFTYQVIRVYSFEVTHSVGRPHFEYPDLRPTIESIAAHAPLAAVNTVTRPWLGEAWQPLYIAAALENVALLVLLGMAAVATARGRAGHMPFELGLGLVIFCVVLAMLMGLTTPNFGSLNRYRSELLPFLLLLLLQNYYAAALLRRVGLGSGTRASGMPAKSSARPVA
ncbi:hypothetical protein Q3A66_05980 [Hymenobacter sp. BT770]|uniref:hypothetical protein n=1 Tax=Hymenobacter sp. BT770 TaxID=2886942 RepID=UPI001D0F6C28|nr:hypothetical protein [Hymenobacter sp. BT770]MCC3152415.1 hypothetical protein [Hymenobacter sp. BT770]MDO3414609.1 hypothetical protein [Hymenobacter sp. BT770]